MNIANQANMYPTSYTLLHHIMKLNKNAEEMYMIA